MKRILIETWYKIAMGYINLMYTNNDVLWAIKAIELNNKYYNKVTKGGDNAK